MLAGQLPSLVVERVAVAVSRRIAEDRDVAVLFEPAHLDVVGDVAPDKVASDTIPCRTLGPQRPGMQPLDRRIADHITTEAVVERDDVRVRVLEWLLPRPVARRGHRRHRRLGGTGLRRGRLHEGGGERSAAKRRGQKRPSVVLRAHDLHLTPVFVARKSRERGELLPGD
jgi:hypothetical protein